MMRKTTWIVAAMLCVGAAADPVNISGTVVDPDGQPVAGAQVWMVVSSYDRDVRNYVGAVEGEALTDDEGRFSFDGVEWPAPFVGHSAPVALARAEGYALGWDAPERLHEEVRVVLQAAEPVVCSVLSAAEEPLGEVRARVCYLGHLHEDQQDRIADWLHVPEDLAEIAGYQADEDGQFVVDVAPANSAIGLMVDVAGYRTMRCYVREGRLALRLGEPGALAGRLVCEDAAGAVARTLYITGGHSAGLDDTGAYRVKASLETDEQGRFALDGLPPGDYEIVVRNDADDQWQCEDELKVTLEAGQNLEDLDMTLHRAWPVTGTVTEVDTGESIAGVSITIHNAGRAEGRATSVRLETDENGKYRVFFLPGKATVSVYPGADYVHPRPYYEAVEVVAGEGGVKDATLHRAAEITGLVVDENGKPVAGAEVRPYSLDRWRADTYPLTDAEGKFVWSGLRPDEELALSAVTDTAVTAQPTTAIAGQDQPLRLVVSAQYASGLRGRVVDDTGEPITDAKVGVIRRINFPGESHQVGYRRALTLTTDEDGRFAHDALFGNAEYSLEVVAPGFPETTVESWTAARRTTHDVGEIVLTGGRAALAGVVVDEDGQPVVGVRAFNRGDGPAATETVTDAEGRFELTGLFEGQAYAFVEAEGYRFTGVRAETGRDDLRIVLPSADGPRPERPCQPPSLDRERQRELIEEVVREGMELVRGDDERTMRKLVGALARVNPVLGQQLWHQEALGDEAELAKHLPFGLAATDPEAALDWAWKVADSHLRAHYLLDLARRFVGMDRDMAEQAFSLAATSARGAKVSSAACYLARIAMSMMQSGFGSWQEVAREAGDLAGTLGKEDWRDCDARAEAAMALAPVDLEAARALIEGLSERGQSYASMARSRMVMLLAGTDPQRAEQLLNEWDLSGGGGRMAGIAWEMAAVDLDRALAFAGSIKDKEERGYALACIGLRLADNDAEGALDLIDEGMAQATDEPRRGTPQYWGRSGEMAAMVAYVGLQAGYPDMQGLVMRAMSLRPDAGQPTGGLSPDGVVLPNTALERWAKALAFVDAATARQVIQPLLMSLTDLAESRSGYHYVHMWVGAAAVADPEWTLEFARALPDDEAGTETPLKLCMYRRLAEVLAMTPEEKLDEVMGYWAPGTPVM